MKKGLKNLGLEKVPVLLNGSELTGHSGMTIEIFMYNTAQTAKMRAGIG
jgi:hypothetical protein